MRGFILLEVLVSIMLSSMIFMSLMGALFQLSRARVTADDAIEVYTRISTIVELMEQDFGGATIPVQAELPKDKKQEAQPTEQKSDAQKNDQKQEQSQEQTAGKEQKTKPVKNIFYSTIKDKNIDLVTCITNNPTKIYWSDTAGRAKPRIARVVYALVPDKAHKESFLLKRQEGSELDFAAYSNAEKPAARAYEIAEGIKEFSITYLYTEKKEEAKDASGPVDPKASVKESAPKKDDAAKKELQQKPDYKTQKSWGMEEKEGGEKTSKAPLIPLFMQIHIVLWNSTYKRDYTFDFVIELCADESQQIKQAQMRYETEKNANAVQPQQPAVRSIIQPIAQPESPKAPVNNAPLHSQEELDFMAYNKSPQRSDYTKQEREQEPTQKEPIILASEGPLPKNFEEKLAENIMESLMREAYERENRENNETQQEGQENQAEKSKAMSDDFENEEQLDMPAGRIDVIKDGDNTYVVYQGPVSLTQEALEEAFS